MKHRPGVDERGFGDWRRVTGGGWASGSARAVEALLERHFSIEQAPTGLVLESPDTVWRTVGTLTLSGPSWPTRRQSRLTCARVGVDMGARSVRRPSRLPSFRRIRLGEPAIHL
jgi:hypothetical protein